MFNTIRIRYYIADRDYMEKKEYINVIVPVALFYLILHFSGIGCPVRYITGIPCAGCGMTRAWISLIHLDIGRAFYFHPLFLLPVVFCVIWLFKDRIPHKIYIGFLTVIVMLFMAVYFARLLNPENTVFEINVNEGLIGRLIRFYNY